MSTEIEIRNLVIGGKIQDGEYYYVLSPADIEVMREIAAQNNNDPKQIVCKTGEIMHREWQSSLHARNVQTKIENVLLKYAKPGQYKSSEEIAKDIMMRTFEDVYRNAIENFSNHSNKEIADMMNEKHIEAIIGKNAIEELVAVIEASPYENEEEKPQAAVAPRMRM